MSEDGKVFICTAATPWTAENSLVRRVQRTQHPDAEEIDDRDFGGGEYCIRYRCPHCGHEFWVELPQ